MWRMCCASPVLWTVHHDPKHGLRICIAAHVLHQMCCGQTNLLCCISARGVSVYAVLSQEVLPQETTFEGFERMYRTFVA